ncbi:MAG TPA: hemerythrin family protein [Desulfuromonadales bacterium]|nr:hemerythrin family protein [Desulfuromonadales bacterium]
MGQMVWKSSFAIGIEEIDRQHQLLLTYFNKNMENNSAAVGLFGKLKAYAGEHFAGEEKLMRKINYPGLEGHQLQHRLFEEQMEHLEETVKNNESQAIIALVSFMRDWFLDHILVADANYASYMRATMAEDDIAMLVAFGCD